MLLTRLPFRSISHLLKLQGIRQIFGRQPIHTLNKSRDVYSLELRVNPPTMRHSSCLLYTPISLYPPINHLLLKRNLSSHTKAHSATSNNSVDLNATPPATASHTGDSNNPAKPLFLQWTEEEIATLKEYAPRYRYNWNKVANHIPARTASACKYYWKKLKMKPYVTGPWTPDEDELLKQLIEEEGTINQWHKFAKVLGRRPRDCLSRVKYIFHTQM